MSVESSNWVEELKSLYRSGESIIFLLHGNIHDIYPWEEESSVEFVSFSEYLRRMLHDKKDYLLEYNLSDGFRIPVKPHDADVKYQEFFFIRHSKYKVKEWVEQWLSQDYGHNN